MMESTGPISSAVILPEPELPKSPRAKRRQSSTSDASSKRPKLSRNDGTVSPTVIQVSPLPTDSKDDEFPRKLSIDKKTNQSNQDKRKSSVQEEKKRGKRLFGGLLSTLSQSTPNGQQKRRLEIEKRQAERVKQQRLDDETRNAEKLAKLKDVRIVEQVKFDEESMRIRHLNLLAKANFLCTKSQPKIYYKPWELLPSDDERIKDQIAEAEATIKREVDELNLRHPKAVEEASEEGNNKASKETVGEPEVEPPSVSNTSIHTTNPPVEEAQSEQGTTENNIPEEHNGEVVVEAEEDTVIY